MKRIILVSISLFLSLYAVADKDIGVINIITPISGCELSDEEEVQLQIFNFGESLPLALINISYSINGGTPVTQSPLVNTFDSLETMTVTFVTKADLSVPGTYVFKIYTDLTDDANRFNDTMTVTVINYANSIGGSVLSDVIVCSGMNYDTLFLSGSLGTVQQWQYTDDGGSSWIPLVNTDTLQAYNNLTETRSYRVLVKNGLCASTYSDTATVSVDPKALGGSITGETTVCTGLNGDTLHLTGYFGDILKWQFNDGSGWTNISNNTDTLTYKDLIATTTYRAIITSGVCPNDTSDLVTIKVINETLGGNIFGSDSVCSGTNSDTLILSNHLGNIKWWESSTDGGFSWVPVSNTDTTLKYNNLTITTRYRVLVEVGTCPSSYSDTAIVRVDQVSEGGAVGNDTLLCDSINSGTLHLENSYGNVLMWEKMTEPTSWTSIANTSDQLYYSNITINTSYRAIVQNGVCPADTSTHAEITSSITHADFSVPEFCYKDTAYFTNHSTVQNGSIILNSWDFGDNSSTITQSPTHIFNDLGSYTVSLVITTNKGCNSKATKKVDVKKCYDYGFIVSNLVTPNGDGHNDSWYIENIEGYPECQISVYNRYGISVFETSAYSNNWQGNSEGSQLPDGTYYYIITCPGTDELFKGHLTILTK